MARGKLTVKLIEKEKARMATYQKRKIGLKKKAQEFATLCDVPTCMIIYGPKLNNRPSEIETWPKERNQFMQVVNMYRERAAFSVRGVKTQNLFDFFAGRQRKLDENVAKLHKANIEAKFPRGSLGDQHLNGRSVDELKALLARIDSSLEIARRRIVMLRSVQQSGSQSWVLGGCSSNKDHQCVNPNLFHKNMEQQEDSKMRRRQQQQLVPTSSVRPQLPAHYNTPDPQPVQMLPYDLDPIDNPMMMMNNSGELTQFGSVTGCGGMTYPQLQDPLYLDPMNAMLDNAMPNGTNPRALCYYASSSTMQPLQSLQPYEQCSVLPSFCSQTQMQMQMQNGSQFNHEFHHEINHFGIKNKKGNL